MPYDKAVEMNSETIQKINALKCDPEEPKFQKLEHLRFVVTNRCNLKCIYCYADGGESINSFADLAGKTLYATGQGATPEYALRYLLKANGLDGDNAPQIRWCADTTEALSYISNDANAVAMLPQPFVTAAQSKISDLRVALSLDELWKEANDGASMATGVLVVRSEFAEKYPQQLEKFMQEYAASVKFVNENTEQAAQLVGAYEIVKAPIAQKALPYCNICCITGSELTTVLDGYLSALYDMNPQSVGGKLPDDGIYYEAK